MKRKLVLIFLFCLPFLLKAQYYVQGEDPARIHWKQINTNNFQIIYPDNFEDNAQRTAFILEKVYNYAGQSLKHQPRKISVILHTNTVRSNGFAAWAPARVELFTTPDQSIYAQDWLEQLAIHEFRHVVQIDKIGSEMPEIFKIILGEQAAAVVIGAYLPFWFLEGDAVATETALSHSGRGRVPSFSMELKAQGVEKGFFSYDKAYLGSFKHYVPDYYQFGYQMVAGIRNKYGSDVWSKVLTNVARQPLSLFAFSKGLKDATGKNQKKLYQEIFSDLKTNWEKNDVILEKTEFQTVTKNQSGYASYRYPYPINDSTVFAVKSSLDNLTKFVKIRPKGEENAFFTPGSLFEESVTFGLGKVFWIEAKPDIRWAHREYSQLRILNVNTSELIENQYNYKIFAPCLSPDEKSLAVIKLDSLNRCSIVILSPTSGKIIKETLIPQNLFVISPSWAKDNSGLFAVVLGNKGKTLAKIDPLNGAINELIPYTYSEVQHPVQYGNWVFYTNTIDGTDDIYAFDLIGKKNFRVTTSRFGAKDPQVTSDGNYLLYSNYTSDGFKPVKMALNAANFKSTDPSTIFKYGLADQLTSQEKGIPDFTGADTTKYESLKYSKFGHLFNFHSWSPVHIDSETQDIRPGVSLMSQNKLSTAITQIGYDYSTTNKIGKWVGKFQYTGLFPVLKLDVDFGPEKSQYNQITRYTNSAGQTVRIDTQLINFTYHVMDITGKINLPLNLSHGKMYRLIQPEFQVGYSKITQESTAPSTFFRGSIIPLTYRLYAHNLLRLGTKDLQSRFGQVVDLMYRHSPIGDRNFGTISLASGTLYLPGVLKHHGLSFYSGWQQKTSAESTFSDLISYPRGCRTISNNQFFSLKSDYVLPLFYPDLSIGNFIYFKRFSLRLFYDYASAMVPIHGTNTQYRYNFGSTGGELTTDCNLLRLLVPAKIGVRSSYLNASHTMNVEFLFSINFNAL